MPYALELALDDTAAAAVRALWRDLAGAGFRFMHESGANPHVSLAIWDAVDRDAMEPAIAAFAATSAPIDVVFRRVDAFPSTGVVFLAPDVSPELVDVHARAHRQLAALGRDAWPHYAPSVWSPHCTLAQDLAGELDAALSVARRAALPLRGRLERAELVEFRPVRCVAVAPLGLPPRG